MTVGRVVAVCLGFSLALASARSAYCDPAQATGPDASGRGWRSYNGSLDGERYFAGQGINSENAKSLEQTCRLQLASGGSFEASPLVIGGTLYVTVENKTLAVDLAKCAVRWSETYHPEEQGIVAINRGLAYANGRLFRGTEDARVIALDAATGAELWRSVAGDPHSSEYIDGAPLAWNGLVYVGIAGSEWGIKGRVLAFDAVTGREVWQVNTIARDGEPGGNTWGSTAWAQRRGGATWSSFSLDPATSEIFIPVANPVPDFSGSARPGDNLFTDSVLVLDALSGKRKWWYQLQPNDAMDWDLAAAPMLFVDAQGHRRVAAAGKDGYLYVIDRDSHKLVFRVPTTTVDAHPRKPTPSGVTVCPGPAGGTLWNGPAFDVLHDSIIVGSIDMCAEVRSGPAESYKPGKMLLSGSWQIPGKPASGWITSFDAETGKTRWKVHTAAPILSGITVTAGGIVMAGDNAGNFMVLDSGSGKLLKTVSTGGSLSGGIDTFEMGSRQYVAFDSGTESPTIFGALGRPSIIVMSPTSAAGLTVGPDERGRAVYEHHCLACHGSDGTGVHGVDLRKLGEMTHEQLADWIKNPRPPMPRVFIEPLDHEDVSDLNVLVSYLLRWR